MKARSMAVRITFIVISSFDGCGRVFPYRRTDYYVVR
jgi:hypothetical protein